MSCQMVLPAKTLGTVLAQEVLSTCVDDHVSSHILSCVETAITVVTWVFLLLGATRRLSRVALEMLQEHRCALIGLHANFTGEITCCGRVHGHVALISQLGVVVLPTLLTLEGLFVRVMGLQVVLQVVFSVKHFLTERALMGLLRRVCGHMPAIQHNNKHLSAVCVLSEPLLHSLFNVDWLCLCLLLLFVFGGDSSRPAEILALIYRMRVKTIINVMSENISSLK